MKVDSKLIARMVGVSQATVSRAFNNSSKVAPKTREAIFDAAKRIGYKLDKNASALRRKGTGRILLLRIHHMEAEYWTNIKRNYWIFAEAIISLSSYFENQPYLFEIKSVDSLSHLGSQDIKEMCDGIILFDSVSAQEASIIHKWGIPYVLAHRAVRNKLYNYCTTDNFRGGELMAQYFINSGKKRPALILNYEDPYAHNLRKSGFLSKYNGEVKIFNLGVEDFEKWKTLNLLGNLIERKQIDSIAFINDMLLVQTFVNLLKMGISIPENLLTIGYDNSPVIEGLYFRPATIDIGIRNIYARAAEGLLKLIRKEIAKFQQIIEPSIVLPDNNSDNSYIKM